jgi:recombination protein U
MSKNYQTDQEKALQRYRNRQSNGFGKNFERFVEMGCDFYKRKGLADISRIDESFRVIKLKQGGKFEGQFTRNANPDFEGTLKGGKSICFECKYTSKDRIRQSVVTDYQAEVLDRKFELGGISGVLCGIQERYFFIPWPVWKGMENKFNKKSVSADDLEKYEVYFNNGIRFLDGYFWEYLSPSTSSHLSEVIGSTYERINRNN